MHPILFHIGAFVIPSYGAAAALGVLLALVLAMRTARITGLNPGQVWNLSVVALFAAVVGSRLLLVVVNFTALRSHPRWLLGLATIHHPLLGAAAAFAGLAVAAIYAHRYRMPAWTTADALAAPLALGLAFEQFGALLAGAGYGTETTARWAVIYTHSLDARWSGAPLGVPLHPVQGYAALAFLTLAAMLTIWLPLRTQQGDLAGLCLLGTGVTVFITEFWRDPEGRGTVLGGALDGPQVAAIMLVIAGALALKERNGRAMHTRQLEAKNEAAIV